MALPLQRATGARQFSASDWVTIGRRTVSDSDPDALEPAPEAAPSLFAFRPTSALPISTSTAANTTAPCNHLDLVHPFSQTFTPPTTSPGLGCSEGMNSAVNEVGGTHRESRSCSCSSVRDIGTSNEEEGIFKVSNTSRRLPEVMLSTAFLEGDTSDSAQVPEQGEIGLGPAPWLSASAIGDAGTSWSMLAAINADSECTAAQLVTANGDSAPVVCGNNSCSSWRLVGKRLMDGEGRAESDLVWIQQPSAGRDSRDIVYQSHDGGCGGSSSGDLLLATAAAATTVRPTCLVFSHTT